MPVANLGRKPHMQATAVRESNDLAGNYAHPLAGRTMTGAEIIVQVLADEGVRAIFGYSGGAILPTSAAALAPNPAGPVRDSMADSVPVVVICGQVPTAAIGSDAFQEAPVSAIMGPVAK